MKTIQTELSKEDLRILMRELNHSITNDLGKIGFPKIYGEKYCKELRERIDENNTMLNRLTVLYNSII